MKNQSRTPLICLNFRLQNYTNAKMHTDESSILVRVCSNAYRDFKASFETDKKKCKVNFKPDGKCSIIYGILSQ